jgi:hypothetical protein
VVIARLPAERVSLAIARPEVPCRIRVFRSKLDRVDSLEVVVTIVFGMLEYIGLPKVDAAGLRKKNIKEKLFAS